MSKKQRTKFNVSYNTEGRTVDDIVFDSAMERDFYIDVIKPLIESGDVVELELQKPFELQPKFTYNETAVRAIVYVADFYYKTADGNEHVVDVKGYADAQAKMKRKIFWYVYPNIDYVWMTKVKKFGGWLTYEEVQKRRKENKKSKGL